ncbi:MAG: hypothetical protein IJR85_00855 [Synergistaceae bacterium]|nr:hypothetical protein [Synergistaceae bacterium]
MAKTTPEQIRAFQRATLMDDEFMTVFFKDNIPAVQFVLRILMGKPDLIVKTVKVQVKHEAHRKSRMVIFDVYAVDSEGRHYDIEFQNRSSGAVPYRGRLNSALMDVNMLSSGEDYSLLKNRESVVIFITKYDVLKGGKPIYTIERVIKETGEDYGDGSHIIYVNTSHKDYSTALGKLIHDFRCVNPEEWYYPEFAGRAKELKGGEDSMKILDDMKATERVEVSENIAVNFIKSGLLALEVIAKNCNLSLQRVQELAATISR